jgi:methyltransferase-like protein/2-polyprenyl-3-methyl-5-hydroxy-6-metoxy-1,4-benzoquinol methylase
MSINTYDEVPYPSSSFPQTHPIKLATIARLFGLSPAKPDNCNVLELGCADGANIIPFAQLYPDSTFVGVDLSARQVESGQKAIAEVGLKNVTLQNKNILDFDAEGRKFDFIIVHGIFSWVPEDVRNKILDICSTTLTDNGVAYISYNALPGWHMRGMIRDMMLFHTQQFTDIQQRIGQSRALVKFLAESVPTENNPYGQFLKNELTAMQGWADGYLRHDFLEEENRAFYFHDFVETAAKHNLQYLGEPELSSMLASNFPQQVQETLKKVGRNIIAMEQYMDFLRNRMFRMTLLVKKDTKLNRSVDSGVLKEFFFGALARPTKEDVNLQAGQKEDFRLASGVTISSDSALVKAILVCLHRAGLNHVSFGELMDWCPRSSEPGRLRRPRSGSRGPRRGRDRPAASCCFTAAGLWRSPRRHIRSPRSRTKGKLKATAFARYQALNEPRHVTNLRHVSIRMDAFARHVVSLVDGTRDVDQIADAMADKVKAGLFSVQEGGKNVTETAQLKALLVPRINVVIAQVANMAFLQSA